MPRVTLLLIVSLASVPGWAGVVSRDLFEPGDGLLTYDDVNQREWLDFSVTSQFFDANSPSYNDFPAALSDFELATLGEVEALLSSASVPEVETWSVPGAAPGSAELIELMGVSGQFSGGIVGTMEFAGGYVAVPNDSLNSVQPDETVAVLAFNFGAEAIGGLNRSAAARASNGYYRLTLADYPFAGGAAQSGSDRTADDLDGNGSSGTTRVIGPTGEVIGLINDFGDLHEFNILYELIQGDPAYWLYRDAVAVPEPATACLVLVACLTSLRLRAFA